MKRLLLTLALAAQLSAASDAQESAAIPKEITVDWLMELGDTDVGGSDYAVCMQTIFNQLKPRAMLEFGLGYGTKYFLDSCKRVISVEVVTHGYGPERLKRFLDIHQKSSNWIPIAFFSGYRGDMSWAPYKFMGTDAVYVACSYQCATSLHYAPLDGRYIKELTEFLSNLVKFNKIEVVLIHPILFLRGDLVEVCFGKIPVIVAHNTAARTKGIPNDLWGYTRVKASPDYEEIYLPTREGTTVWVMKKPEFQPLIDALKR